MSGVRSGAAGEPDAAGVRRVTGKIARGEGRAWRLNWLRLWLITRRGRWRSAIAGVLGALATLALPPFHLVPVLVPAFVGLVWLIDDRVASRRTALAIGWWFGFGFFLAGLYWISNAFVVRGPAFAWAGPLAVIGLSALLAGFVAAATLATRLSRQRGVAAVLVLAVAWAAAEWLRGVVLTGFPWNLIGSVWTVSDAMIQATAVIGTGGLGLLTVIAAAMPASLAGRAGSGWRTPAVACGVAFAVLGLVWGGGALRLAVAGPAGEVAEVQLRLVQPSIPQALKWRPERLDAVIDAHIALSRSGAAAGEVNTAIELAGREPVLRGPGGRPPTLVIWAETAAPLFLDEDPERLARVAAAAPAGGHLIVGSLRRQPVGGPFPFEIRNSLLVITAGEGVVTTYDKVHLVPFGEYVPLSEVLGLMKLTEGNIDLSPGPGLATLDLPGVPPFSPLICYEVIFPGAVRAPGSRPEWLLNLTNDAWYGVSTGPYQHFAAARLRAVEEGLPLVRVANTGISAVVDGHGRTLAALGLEEVGVVEAPLPAALAGPTPYGRYGDLILLVLGLGVTGLAVLAGRRPASRSSLPEG